RRNGRAGRLRDRRESRGRWRTRPRKGEGDMSDSDLMFRSASELAGMVRSGEVSARELVECSLQRIEELNPTLNAFVDVDGERALETADQIGSGHERAFAGVPVAIKNNRPVKGMRLTYGCALMAANMGED